MEPIRIMEIPLRVGGYCIGGERFDHFTTTGKFYSLSFNEDRTEFTLTMPDNKERHSSVHNFLNGGLADSGLPMEVLAFIASAVELVTDSEDDSGKRRKADTYSFNGLAGLYRVLYAKDSDEIVLIMPPLIVAGTRGQIREMTLRDIEGGQLIRWLGNIVAGNVQSDKKRNRSPE